MYVKNISIRKMPSCFLLLYFSYITLIIFLAAQLSNGENANYTICSQLYSCGNIKNIGYPFWGGHRPKICGILDFKLNCPGNKTYPTMNVYRNGYAELSVLSINTSSNTMFFSQDNLFHHCYLRDTTYIALLPTLKPDSSYRNISLVYGCTNCNVSQHYSNSFNCSNDDGSNGLAYYFDKSSNISRFSKECSCKNTVKFLVDKRGLDKSTETSLLNILKKSQIKTNYLVNFSACSKCKKSGGRCGSSADPVSEFVCYCPNGPYSQRCPNNDDSKFGLILGLGIGGALLVLVAITGIWHHKRPKFVNRSASLDCSPLEREKGNFGVPLFSYSELVEATANFDRSKELGNGGYGIVYYGKLKDGREVAVKRLFEKSYRRLEQFMNEVQILTHLRHQNLVSLYGCTSQHCRELLLVYEYVKNGTVADHLYAENTKSVLLPWAVRLRIAIETATALSYLHASDIIHRDVKTNNILLDSNFSVKVADFGLSRLFPIDVTHVSTAPQGSPGYLDPEYHQCYQLTDKSDVYSFGVVLIELISSLPAIDINRPKHEINLFNYAMNRIQRSAFDELVDPRLGFVLDFKVRRMTTLVAELAFQCLQHDKEFRPSMDEILKVLISIEGADYEALQAEEMAMSVRVEDCEALQTKEMVDNAGVDFEALQAEETANPPSSSSHMEDDHAHLSSINPQLYSSSPISVMDKWVSRSTSTTPSTSK